MKSFQRAPNHLKDDIRSLGVDVSLFGSHNARKGAATLAACGCTVSQPVVSIYLRARWSMGLVKECYLFYKKAGDQFVQTINGILILQLTTFETEKDLLGKLKLLILHNKLYLNLVL